MASSEEDRPSYDVERPSGGHVRRLLPAALGLALLIGALLGVLTFWPRPLPSPLPSDSTTAPSAVAHATSIEGHVRIRRLGRLEWHRARPGMALHEDDEIEAVGDASAGLTFIDGTLVGLRPGGLMHIEARARVKGAAALPGRSRRARLVTGELDFSAPVGVGQQRATTLSTDALEVEPRPDSAGGLSVTGAGDSEVRISRGEAQVRGLTGETQRVESNQALRSDAAGHLSPPVSLPAPPELVSPPDGGRLSLSRPELRWRAASGSSAYRVQVAGEPSFTQLLLDELTARAWISVQGLEPDHAYFWRVAAATAAGDGLIVGEFSPATRFTALPRAREAAGGAPPLEIEAFGLRGQLLRVKGHTAPRATVTINGQPADVGAAGAFDEYVTLAGAGVHEVKVTATGASGASRELVRTIVVEGP